MFLVNSRFYSVRIRMTPMPSNVIQCLSFIFSHLEILKVDKSMKKRRISDQDGHNSSNYPFEHEEHNIYDFHSTGTQTCVCGYIDWHDATWQKDFLSTCDDLLHPEKNLQSGLKMQKPSDSQPNTSTKSSNIKSSSASVNKTAEINLSDYDCRLCSYPIDNFNNDSIVSGPRPRIDSFLTT